jgi:hypothetical protein
MNKKWVGLAGAVLLHLALTIGASGAKADERGDYNRHAI